MFTSLTHGVWPVNRHWPGPPVLDWLHVSPLGLLYICVTTEPQLANESQALTVHRMLTHKPWSVLRTTTVDLPAVLAIAV